MTRPLVLLTTTLAALSLAASTALADASVSISGSSDASATAGPSSAGGSLTGALNASLGDSFTASLTGTGTAAGSASAGTAPATLTVTGDTVSSVSVFINGKKLKTTKKAAANGSYTLTISRKRLRHATSADAVVHFDGGMTQTLQLSASSAG
jgi:hypothetical protein